MLSQHSSAMSRNEGEEHTAADMVFMRLEFHEQPARASIATLRSLMGRPADVCAQPRAKGRASASVN